MNFPEKMNAVILENYNPNLIRALGSMKVREVPVPVPAAGQLLVKVEASPVNPSDIAFLRGGYNIVKPVPAIPGFEGVGKIVAVEDGVDETLIGERITFFIQNNVSGAWAEYALIGENDFIPVSMDLPVEQAACLFINPFTAYALFEHIHENQHEALIQSAANGQVGRFIRYFANEHNVEVINLVRKPGQLEQLRAEGNEHVLDTGDDNFYEKLKEIARRLNATAAIDAVGGELTGKMLNTMPDGSEIILYGALSGMPLSAINPLDLIFKNKVIGGFNLNDWIAEKSAEEFSKVSGFIQMLFIERKLETRISQSFAMDDFYNGLRTYISNMSAGKVLFSM